MLEVLARRITELSEHPTGMGTEKVTQVVSEKSDLVGASDESGGFGPSPSSSMADLNQELITEVSQAVEEMTSKWTNASFGGGDPPGESHPVEVPSYLDIKPSDIKYVRQIGDAGASSVVYEATWSRCPCAVKRFKSEYNRELVSVVQQELNFLIALRHPHIVRLMGLSVDSQGRCSIVMELMSSSLRELIKRRSDLEKKEIVNAASIVPFTLSEAMDIITKIALGMWFLHSKGISHRDLKSANVLIQDFGDYIKVKIVDFGASLNIESDGMQGMSVVGTGFWRAPEILRLRTDKSTKPDLKAADVYSFAMTCYEVLTGGIPFAGHLRSYEYDKVINGLRPELPGNLDDDLTSLIKLCWAPDPKDRPNFEKICEQLLCMRAKRSALRTNTFCGKIREVYGAFTGLLDRVLGKEQNTSFPDYESSSGEDDDSSSGEDQSEGQALQGSDDAHNFFAECNLRLGSLSIIKPNDLKSWRYLGRGTTVYAATWLGCRFAVKRFKYASYNIGEVAKELEFLITLCHPHIVQLVGLSVGPKEHECSIVMELMSCSLRELIESQIQKQKRSLIAKTRNTNFAQPADVVPFDLHELLRIIGKIALGMAFLHSREVMHRDLKSLNVLIHQHSGSIDVKIVDFGVSQYEYNADSTETDGSYVGVGTGFWRAPEILPADTADRFKKPDLKAADVYSFAMTCYEVLTGGIPFSDLRQRDYDIVISGLRPPLPFDLHPELKVLIEKCWHGEPEQRPDFSYICDEIQRIEQALSSSTS